MNIPLNLKIEKGAIKVNGGYILKKSKDLIAIEIDLTSKYAKVGGYGSGECPMLFLYANEDTLKIDGRRKNKDTEIHFLDFAGYDVFATSIGRYTLSVCLIRNRY